MDAGLCDFDDECTNRTDPIGEHLHEAWCNYHLLVVGVITYEEFEERQRNNED